ncbi:uncharacterized protein LOC116255476 isoform X2 [Nymphaea colorata]|uniref:uncharacterized protein LOC116255476 isoform X2 n=1 Tax=Nymphaea colorata TaxID=210225 RepID=UPI00214E6F91|nr:uncharacterized protein LOC116255476 isoform X2 [Nymphaea colorata]
MAALLTSFFATPVFAARRARRPSRVSSLMATLERCVQVVERWELPQSQISDTVRAILLDILERVESGRVCAERAVLNQGLTLEEPLSNRAVLVPAYSLSEQAIQQTAAGSHIVDINWVPAYYIPEKAPASSTATTAVEPTAAW